MWEVVLVTLAWDVSEAAISEAASGSTRVARGIARWLLEYGARAHFYLRAPDKAHADGDLSLNMLRRVMKPTVDAVAELPKQQKRTFEHFISSGSSEVPYPAVQAMIKAMLKNFNLTQSSVRKFARLLEVEYAFGSGVIHGSQIEFFEVFGQRDQVLQHHERSSVFFCEDELLRIATCLLVLLHAIELHYKVTYRVHESAVNLRSFVRLDTPTTITQHNSLLRLLNIG